LTLKNIKNLNCDDDDDDDDGSLKVIEDGTIP